MKHIKMVPGFVAALAVVIILAGCAKPVEEKKPPTETGPKHEYKDIKPAVYEIPEGVKTALPGLQNDKIYIYREIAPTLNLVAYVPNYSLAEAPVMAAKAFESLAAVPEFRQGVDFWIIQLQPEASEKPVAPKPEEAGQAKPNAEVFVWGVKPSEVDDYIKSHDLMYFLVNSEYLLINDEIIPKGEARGELFPSLRPTPEPMPEQGSTAGARPGDTAGQ